jgi:hypothetical protein
VYAAPLFCETKMDPEQGEIVLLHWWNAIAQVVIWKHMISKFVKLSEIFNHSMLSYAVLLASGVIGHS